MVFHEPWRCGLVARGLLPRVGHPRKPHRENQSSTVGASLTGLYRTATEDLFVSCSLKFGGSFGPIVRPCADQGHTTVFITRTTLRFTISTSTGQCTQRPGLPESGHGTKTKRRNEDDPLDGAQTIDGTLG